MAIVKWDRVSVYYTYLIPALEGFVSCLSSNNCLPQIAENNVLKLLLLRTAIHLAHMQTNLN